jgi:hypothetical protein
MKLLTKLSNLIKAVARGPARQPPWEKRVPEPNGVSYVEAEPEATTVEQEQPLEQGRVADLLQQKLARPTGKSESSSQPREKGD